MSKEHGWVFVGTYDGFNVPNETVYLFTNLYGTVHSELKGMLWIDIQAGDSTRCGKRETAWRLSADGQKYPC